MAREYLTFVGVTASRSSINEVFPRWAGVLGLDAGLRPLDLALDTSAEEYRQVVEELRDDPRYVGALVTTHKVRLLEAARDLFDGFDEYAELCHELSCIVSREGRLHGAAKDPVTSGQAFEDLVAEDHFSTTGGEVVCLGAGGSGLAFVLYLIGRRASSDRPSRIVLVNRSPERLKAVEEVLADVDRGPTSIEFRATSDPREVDAVIAGSPPGTVVANATGLGKDRPGSPSSDEVRFPDHAVVWDFNYRGDLRFLQQARTQAEQQSPDRRLRIEDGWRYFVYGWSAVIAEVFDLDLTSSDIDRLAEVAADLRPSS